MITLSSVVVPETVGFLRLFRRVTQTIVEVAVSIDELTVAVNDPGVREKPTTDRKTKAPPLWLDPPPSQATRSATTASAMREWRPRDMSVLKMYLIAAA